jgi:hypothetical protein
MAKLSVNIQLATDSASTKVLALEIATAVPDMTFRQWVDYHLLVENWPDWLQEFGTLSQDEQQEASQDWTDQQKAEYYLQVLKVIDCFSSGGSLADLCKIPLLSSADADTASIELIGRKIFTGLASYVPSEDCHTFIHAGHTYKIQEDDVLKIAHIKQVTRLPGIEAGAVIEALQRAHIYNSTYEDGTHILNDRRYHTDLAMIACIARRQAPDGSLEAVPWGMENFASFVTSRMAELEDLPANIAINASFFLASLLKDSLHTAISRWLSKNQAKQKHQRRPDRG